MKKYISIHNSFYVLMMALLVLVGCSKDTVNGLDTNVAVQLSSFGWNGAVGEIDQNAGTITLNVPFGTDITALKPQISLPAGARIVPAAEETLNFSGVVQYTVYNGNLFKDYEVKTLIAPPLVTFKIGETSGNINHTNKNISFLLPDGQAVEALVVNIATAEGVTVSPQNGSTVDFTQPVVFTFTANGISVDYTVSVVSNSIYETAFLGTAASRSQITNPDEKAAADWFFTNYPESDYLSFQSIETGIRLSNYKVIWWHYTTQDFIPDAASKTEVIQALKAYRAQGGGLFLSGMASLYVELLGVVPAGHIPNNVWGDFGDDGFVSNDNWGISFRGRESHPIFQGLSESDPGKAFLVGGNTHRQNQGSWWFLGEWVVAYANAAQWRTVTNGVNLASEHWDDFLDGRVAIAEWPNDGNQGNVVVIGAPSCDWYSEPLKGGDPINPYLDNIKKLTHNIIDYLLL